MGTVEGKHGPGVSRRSLLRSAAAVGAATVLQSPVTPADPVVPVSIVASVRPPGIDDPSPSGPFRPTEFATTGVFDVDWLVTPRFERVLDDFAASPGAFRAVRFFGALNAGTTEARRVAGGGDVWPAPGAPMDFSRPFEALAALTSRGLTPWIVLGFFPRAVSPSPTTPPASFDGWKRLVGRFLDELRADHRFGDAITDWWFEVWNEPNVAGFWGGDFERYLDLYRATSEAVVAGHGDLRLGGPAIAYYPHGSETAGKPLMGRFLTFLRDEPEVKCDFLSLHAKGSYGREEPDLGNPIGAVTETAEAMLAIDPDRFRGVPIVNDEADMRAGFAVPYEPRMTEQFAAWLAAVTIAYDASSARYAHAGIRFLAAADGANQQLVARPFDGRRSVLTSAGSPDELFKLPCYNYYELLRLLGERHGTIVRGREHCFPRDDLFHAITVADTHVALVFTSYPSSDGTPGPARRVDYTLRDVPWPTANVARFQIDAARSNAYTAAGRTLAPPVPDAADARRIRRAQELSTAGPIRRGVEPVDGVIRERFRLDPYAVLCYWITPTTDAAPTTPGWIEARVEGGNVTLRWEPSLEPFVYTYEVWIIDDGRLDALLSPVPLRAATWIDTAPARGSRTYGVRAVSASGIASGFARVDVRT